MNPFAYFLVRNGNSYVIGSRNDSSDKAGMYLISKLYPLRRRGLTQLSMSKKKTGLESAMVFAEVDVFLALLKLEMWLLNRRLVL
jgi:hypothetical protein